MWPKQDLTWKTFHWLTVEWLSNERRWKSILRVCRCKCGNVVLRTTSHLNEKVLHSCWCRWWKYHHQTGTHFYRKYQEAKKRCSNPKVDSYRYYGGRWIKFRWDSFEDFRKDMYQSYVDHIRKFWEKNTSLDRIDNNEDYCKENCRRATLQEQSCNRRNIILIEYKWAMYSQRQLEKKLWLWVWSISSKLKRWVPIEWILTNPHKRFFKKYL